MKKMTLVWLVIAYISKLVKCSLHYLRLILEKPIMFFSINHQYGVEILCCFLNGLDKIT